jgi:predicted Fe-S protein YdhL (DUF1289 family)
LDEIARWSSADNDYRRNVWMYIAQRREALDGESDNGMGA